MSETRQSPMNETKDEPREGSMTPPDPVEEKLREMERSLAESFYGKGAGPPFQTIAARHLKAAGVPALLADTQSKDERIAELQGALRELRETAVEFASAGYPASRWTIEASNAWQAKRGRLLDALASTVGVASDGGEDG